MLPTPATMPAMSSVPISSVPISPVGTALADVLAAGRSRFNQRVAEVRQRQPSFNTEAFATLVRTGLNAVAQSVAAVAPERTPAAVAAAYDIALELVAQGLAGPGARHTVVDRVWTDVAPRCAHLVALQPTEVLGALSNAASHLGGVATARVDEWLHEMARLAAHAPSVGALKALGQVAAWRAGLAHFRDGALAAADTLAPPLALLALGDDGTLAADEWPRVRDAHRADRWWCLLPQRRDAARDGLEVGSFVGLGGSFAQPPRVRACAQGFVVQSAERFSLLVADVYGAMLLPSSAPEFEQAQPELRPSTAVLSGTQLLLDGRRIDLDLPQDGLAVTHNGVAVALTSPYSHAVRVYPAYPAS